MAKIVCFYNRKRIDNNGLPDSTQINNLKLIGYLTRGVHLLPPTQDCPTDDELLEAVFIEEGSDKNRCEKNLQHLIVCPRCKARFYFLINGSSKNTAIASIKKRL